MFVLVVQIRSQDAASTAAQHDRYAELAARFPGFRYKHVMRFEADPGRYIDLMAWELQEHSETFGVDPEYQRQRPPSPAADSAPAARAPDNPGYYSVVCERVAARGRILRQEIAIVDAPPGGDRALSDAGRSLCAAAEGAPGVLSLCVLRNLGWPARHAIVAAYATAETSSLAEAAPTRAAWAQLVRCCATPPVMETGGLVVQHDGAHGAH